MDDFMINYVLLTEKIESVANKNHKKECTVSPFGAVKAQFQLICSSNDVGCTGWELVEAIEILGIIDIFNFSLAFTINNETNVADIYI